MTQLPYHTENLLALKAELIRIRKEQGVTEQQMADFLGKTQSAVSKFEHSNRVEMYILRDYADKLCRRITYTLTDTPGFPTLTTQQYKKDQVFAEHDLRLRMCTKRQKANIPQREIERVLHLAPGLIHRMETTFASNYPGFWDAYSGAIDRLIAERKALAANE